MTVLPRQRFLALDALRGLAIALMILVNTPGSWQHVYPPLLHAAWDGFTLADLVFPMFLFAVGAAMYFSMGSARVSTHRLARIGRRAALLFACGLLLHVYPFNQPLTELRIPGVLQRIALCFGIAAVLVLHLRTRGLVVAAVVLPLAYWGMLHLFSEGHGHALEGNAIQRLDIWLLGERHLFQGFGVPFDPEGLLSTLPAVSSVLLGYLVVSRLIRLKERRQVPELAIMGFSLAGLGALWHLAWPINKPLWSGSYVAFSGGLTVLLLALLVGLFQHARGRQWLQPLVTYGTNPLFVYMLAWMWAVTAAELIRWGEGDQAMSLYQWGFEMLAQGLPDKTASLIFALMHVLIFWLVSACLHRRGIYIRL
ncbi:DUF1624 domain-containing protein [Wenzhouxiangella sp. AB-CW3]|uniref:acyltransferase family protein n=1 Tax=Wenzhouxiangella sp. AB-CW3 TaxID=2771012 RepID=UPI00168B878F|nr:heparan-alpha-glucosaminide N-acetyltransferase domain-containing protein [Wenzhouxiangella sp. AB-CW3]QOC21760.1 DUF1624 domain-containing protein [Wenzhouxiangella sp. AB-CW3]